MGEIDKAESAQRAKDIMERKAEELVKKEFYQRTCRLATGTGMDKLPQHRDDYYGPSYKGGTFPCPIGMLPDILPGVGPICPKCAEDRGVKVQLPKVVPKRPRK